MPFITARDGTEIFYKDWGPKSAQPIVFHHGWPLSADDWDAQMMFFLNEGYRVIGHDRRGHGRSTQTDTGNDMDTYASDVEELVSQLDLRNAVHIGHSTGGGEVAHYVARAEPGRVAKAVLISSVPPHLLKTDANPGGVPIEVFDQIRAGTAESRAQYFLDFASGPFYGFNRPGVQPIEGKPQYDCVAALSETDFTEDLKAIDVPVLVLHGEDDQVVPLAISAVLSAKLVRNGTLKTYPGYPHGMPATHADVINKDLLAFIRGELVEPKADAIIAEPVPA